MIKEIITDKEKLTEPCIKCKFVNSIFTADVVENLIDTAEYNKFNCAGLAANQIGHNLRIFVMKIKNKLVPMVNPEFITKSKSFRYDKEGCLSFPGTSVKKKDIRSLRFLILIQLKKNT